MQGFNMGRYVPPDLEGTTTGNRLHRKHPLGSRASKLASHGSLVVRFELPFPVWCATCPRPTLIAQGVRFNARKSRVGAYHSTPIWAFRFRHADCAGEIEVRTDPRNTAYVVIEGGVRQDTGEDKPRDDEEGEDAENRVLTDQEREALRTNAFAKLEKTIHDRARLRAATARLDDLAEASARDWDDPYRQNQRLRRAFRAERKRREGVAAADEDLRERMSLGIDVLPGTEEDERRAALVDFGPEDDWKDAALKKPLFEKSAGSIHKSTITTTTTPKSAREAARRKETLVSELVGNTRMAKDPFLQHVQNNGGNGHQDTGRPSRFPDVKRRRTMRNEPAPGEPPEEPGGSTALVNYDSD